MVKILSFCFLIALLISPLLHVQARGGIGRDVFPPDEEGIGDANFQPINEGEQAGNTDLSTLEGDVILVSPRLKKAIQEWHGIHAEREVSLEKALLESNERLFNDWFTAANKGSKESIEEYVSVNGLPHHQSSRAESSQSLGSFMAKNHPDDFFTWQMTDLPADLRLHEFIKHNHPEVYENWKMEQPGRTEAKPSSKMCLPDYIDRYHPRLAHEANDYIKKVTGLGEGGRDTVCPIKWPPTGGGSGSGSGSGSGANMCKCTHQVSFDNHPDTFQNGWDLTVESDSSKKKDVWWHEEWKAAHYGELYAHVKKEGHLTTFDIVQLKKSGNDAKIRYELKCQNKYLNDCGHCSATLDQYAHYGSNMQIHVDGKGSLFRKLEAKASSGDGAKMSTKLINGNYIGFQKAGVITIDAKAEYDATKVVNVIKGIIGLGEMILKTSKGNPPDATKITKWTTTTYKNLLGIVKYTDHIGTKSHGIKVTYDSVGNSGDIKFGIESNHEYSLKIESSGHTMFEGKGKWAKTNNSFYGSGFAAALTVSQLYCSAGVDQYPKPMGAWSYANTYRSPYSGTSTFQANIKNFIKQGVSSSVGLNVNTHQGFWEVP